MTFNDKLIRAQKLYNCQIVNRGTVNLAVAHAGIEYPLIPETRTIELQQLVQVPREVKQFTETVIDIQEETGFVIH
jgi:hypothetical protein